MKRVIGLLLAGLVICLLTACAGKKAESRPGEWTRQGYYTDENENVLSVSWMDDVDKPGWFVSCMLEEISTGCILPQEDGTLRGNLNAWDDGAEAFVVTVAEEGEKGLQLTVEGGETYHFLPVEMPKASIIVTINTEGMGSIDYAEGESAPETDPDYPFQSAQINLAEPAFYTFAAWPDAGNVFVKWTKNGEDYSGKSQITVNLEESADFVAVFEENAGKQNPVTDYSGDYQCGRACAKVESFGSEETRITIDWGSSAWEMTRWLISGRLDPETLTIDYSDCMKSNLVYSDSGVQESEETEYVNGTGTIVFCGDGSFVWHEDQAEDREDMTFEMLSAPDVSGVGIANPWRNITETEAEEILPDSLSVPNGAEHVRWSVLDSVSDESGIPGRLLQLSFDLDGNSFTAREQMTGDPEADISGMYYEWSVQQETPLKNWGDDSIACTAYRWVGENEYADLCTWYDPKTGISYSLSVTAEDLDGFDLQAVAEDIHR